MGEAITVTDVQEEHIELLWPKVEAYLAGAIERSQGEYSLEDIKYALMSGEMRLWIMYEDRGEVKGCAVCALVQYPQHLACVILHVGGKDMCTWEWAVDCVEDWAAQNGCDKVIAYTRPGMTKVAQRHGFSKIYEVVSKPIEVRRMH